MGSTVYMNEHFLLIGEIYSYCVYIFWEHPVDKIIGSAVNSTHLIWRHFGTIKPKHEKKKHIDFQVYKHHTTTNNTN